MNRLELRLAVREDLQDEKTPYLWSDASINRWINEAQSEACRRSRLLVDSTSPMCTLVFNAGEALLKLNPSILFVKRAIVASDSRQLGKAMVRDLDSERPGWEDETGSPSAWVPDFQAGQIRLDRIPEEETTVRLTVIRAPKPLADDDAEPEIPERYHENMLHWVRFRAYSKQDADTMSDEAANKALALFEMEFGKRSSAIEETWNSANYDFSEYQGAF